MSAGVAALVAGTTFLVAVLVMGVAAEWARTRRRRRRRPR